MGSIARILIVIALLPWLAVSAVFAQEHVHESDGRDHASIAHRHFGPHEHERAETCHLGHDGAEVSDADEDIVWLDQPGIAEATHSFPEVRLVVSTHILIVAQPVRHATVAPDEATLPHGPPRVSPSLRAPPSPLPLI